jgi:hypothetical protein
VVTGLTASGETDRVPARDFYYYVAYVTDLYGSRSPVSNMTAGTLNYYLGDVSNGYVAGAGNDTVFTEDISLLGAHYGLMGAAMLPYDYLDVGPTTNFSVDALPTTDNVIDFEDLILFAINYNAVSAPQAPLADQAATTAPAVTRDEVAIEAPAHVALGDVVQVRVTMKGTGAVQGFATQLAWDAAVVQPVGCAPGDWATAQGATVLSARPGSVDAALLGAGRGFTGTGLVATLEFRALAAGDPKVHISTVDGRDAANQKLPLATSEQTLAAATPTVTRLAPAMPNPFVQTATIAFSLSQSGPVQLVLYSVDGRKVRTLVSEFREAGEYRMTWDGRDDGGAAMRAGVYYAHLVTVKGRFTRTLTYLK